MGLIQKQLKAGLDNKITNWVDANLSIISRALTINEDHRVKIDNSLYVTYIIGRLIEDDLDIPDYISFSTPFVVRYYSKIDPDKLLDTLNKYAHIFTDIQEVKIMAYGTCIIRLEKTDGEFIKILVDLD